MSDQFKAVILLAVLLALLIIMGGICGIETVPMEVLK